MQFPCHIFLVCNSFAIPFFISSSMHAPYLSHILLLHNSLDKFFSYLPQCNFQAIPCPLSDSLAIFSFVWFPCHTLPLIQFSCYTFLYSPCHAISLAISCSSWYSLCSVFPCCHSLPSYSLCHSSTRLFSHYSLCPHPFLPFLLTHNSPYLAIPFTLSFLLPCHSLYFAIPLMCYSQFPPRTGWMTLAMWFRAIPISDRVDDCLRHAIPCYSHLGQGGWLSMPCDSLLFPSWTGWMTVYAIQFLAIPISDRVDDCLCHVIPCYSHLGQGGWLSMPCDSLLFPSQTGWMTVHAMWFLAIPISDRVDDCLVMLSLITILSPLAKLFPSGFSCSAISTTTNVSTLIFQFLFLFFLSYCSPPMVWGLSFALCVVDGLLMIGCRVSTQTF